jgi:hypothetical protein
MTRVVELFYPSDAGGHPQSCATVLLPDGKLDQASRWWALGYWSGQNAAGKSRRVGSQSDGNGIIAEIEKLCRDQPSMSLISAVGKIYIVFQKEGR